MRQGAGRTVAGMFGVTAVALLHSLFFVAAMWGEGVVQRFPDRPEAIGAGANRGTSEGQPAERRMTVRLLTDIETHTNSAPDLAYLLEAAFLAPKLDITGPDALPLPPLIIVENSEPAESTDAELIARTRMIGIYESQIRARIERAWTLPGESAEEAEFTCRVLIRQRDDGRVSEVELPYDQCEGSPAMRQSLVNAIFSASPLPAPPHRGVFVDSFSLILRSASVRRADPLTVQQQDVEVIPQR